jgi:hypothetical protein
MTTVIIAALAIIVLIVLALIFAGRMRIFGTESSACRNLGGKCESVTECDKEKQIELVEVLCPGDDKCCMDRFSDVK